MQPTVKLSINKPCHQDWQNMNPSQQGRFCNACAKEVVDFTGMPDRDVLHYFLNRKKENVCGRFYADQLNRSITTPVYPARKIIWFWNYVAMLFLFLCKGNAGKAQAALPQQPLEQVSNGTQPLKGIVGKVSIAADQKREISGKITNREGIPVAGASLYIKGARQGTLTNVEGFYTLKGIHLKDKITVSAVGYVTNDITIHNYGKNDVVLQEEVKGLLGDVVVTVGGVGANYDYDAPVLNPNHVAIIEVRDNVTSQPVKATVIIKKEGLLKATTYTNQKGIYKLKRIKADDNYTVTLSAAGYKDSVLKINGWGFNERKETRYVFLVKETRAVQASEKRVLLVGGVSSTYTEPLYVIDEVVANKTSLSDIKPEEIESLNVFKGPEATALFGSGAQAGAIVITTKKKKTNGTELVKKKCTGDLGMDKKQVADDPGKPVTAFTNDLKIVPNPVVKGTAVTVFFTAIEINEYMLQVVNEAGAVLHLQKLPVKPYNNTFQLLTKAVWPGGVYYVSIINAENKMVQSGSFIIQ